MKLTETTCCAINLVDAVVTERWAAPTATGTHGRGRAAQVWEALEPLLALDGATLRARRREKFLEMGRHAIT